ncbi:cytidine deaminase [Halorhabdus utahensis DSM 12940]|uniref:cytidine deaminase n=1 Tax=Halorhabdus utahensis (strain DSM 12940 / JCM 11049 / AX-2) TaxID=519442 RepID=C7NNG2_HALUD|nr:cytidine deaminase [Halorhabdus utahensis]ACV11562.1 cytidine deaminase [Halorhabdus utahensis DSM 12940]
MDERALLDAATDALEDAYVPYSEYPVGAALETTAGEVYRGFNVEVVNYSNSLHAEEVALTGALRAGESDFERVAVVSAEHDGLTPCGMCRQTLAEFCADSFEILTEDDGEITHYTLGDLLPAAMKPGNLQDRS